MLEAFQYLASEATTPRPGPPQGGPGPGGRGQGRVFHSAITGRSCSVDSRLSVPFDPEHFGHKARSERRRREAPGPRSG
ncbi:hypothetical protein ABT317_44195, partial [Streptomyces carpinensis]